jgi:dynactin complex subunit
MAEEYLENLQVGDNILYGSEKGIVKFVGNTHFSAGVWVGIELDTPSKLNFT